MHLEVTRDVFRLAQVFTISRGSRTEAQVLTVRLADGSDQGWGECVPYARYDETLDSVTAQINGLPADITRDALYDLLPAGAARNAVDCALWDLEAKRAGKRAWELAGLMSGSHAVPHCFAAWTAILFHRSSRSLARPGMRSSTISRADTFTGSTSTRP